LKALQHQHEVEANAMEKRHLRKLQEKDDMIFNLTEEMNYLVTHREYRKLNKSVGMTSFYSFFNINIIIKKKEQDDFEEDDDDYTSDSDSVVSTDSTARSDYDVRFSFTPF
jgi:hypothetical protein